jgi:hypothetical protein
VPHGIINNQYKHSGKYERFENFARIIVKTNCQCTGIHVFTQN